MPASDVNTIIANVIVPEVFNPYVIQRTAELSALSQAGIISNNPELDRLASAGGKLINMPFWDDLSGDDEVLSDSSALTPAAIKSGQDVAVLFMRGKAWSVNDLATALSGDDPMGAIGDLVAGYWARRRQALLFSMLKGVFAAASMAGNKLDISGNAGSAAYISSSAFIDVLQKLGDAKQNITAVGFHSAVDAYLSKLDLIDTVKDSQGNVTLRTFMGKNVIVDDGCPVTEAGVYTTYLFGPGAIGLGNGQAPVPTETTREALKGNDILINRQHFVLHPRGVKFASASVAGASPTNAEAETATNWVRVYENKNVRLLQLTHKIG